jgi:hypothetical protein|tara:strand:+ start:287 stop:1372 length:1086 start_codon:yes stop_codon:yes gene_type:complete
MTEFEVLRRAVLLRMLREATVGGDMRPLEELLPVDGERVLAAPAQETARKAEAELDQRIQGLLLAAAALAQPALPSLPDASHVLTEDGLRHSIIQLFDAALSKHRVSLLKPLIESGSRALREAIGGFIWAPRRLDFQAARRCAAANTCFHTPGACAACDAASFRARFRHLTWIMSKLEMASRSQLIAGGFVSEMMAPLSNALGLGESWVEDENRSLLCTPAEIDKEDAVQRPKLGLREAVLAPDGTVSVSADLPMHLTQHWASPRRKLLVLPDGRRYISITVSVDGAGLTKKGGETTVSCWTYNDSRLTRSTLINSHIAVLGNFSDGNSESCEFHLRQLRQDLQAPLATCMLLLLPSPSYC